MTTADGPRTPPAREAALISLEPRAGARGICRLCAGRDSDLSQTLRVRPPHAAPAELAVCGDCARALRRLAAAALGAPIVVEPAAGPGR